MNIPIYRLHLFPLHYLLFYLYVHIRINMPMPTVVLQKLKAFAAPKRYVFKDPDTQYLFDAPSLQALVKHILSYRRQNSLPPIEDLNLVLENYWCGLPENCGSCEPHSISRRGLYGYIRGGIALLQNLYYGDESMVDQPTADERASQCATCPNNQFPDKSSFIKWSDEIAVASVGDRKSSHHDKLGNCEVCSCPLRAKVFYKGPFILSSKETAAMREVSCWQLKPNKPKL